MSKRQNKRQRPQAEPAENLEPQPEKHIAAPEEKPPLAEPAPEPQLSAEQKWQMLLFKPSLYPNCFEAQYPLEHLQNSARGLTQVTLYQTLFEVRKVVGRAILQREGTVLRIDQLEIAPECRKLGMGQFLYASILMSAIEKGGEIATLQLMDASEAAKKYKTNHGENFCWSAYMNWGLKPVEWRKDGASFYQVLSLDLSTLLQRKMELVRAEILMQRGKELNLEVAFTRAQICLTTVFVGQTKSNYFL